MIGCKPSVESSSKGDGAFFSSLVGSVAARRREWTELSDDPPAHSLALRASSALLTARAAIFSSALAWTAGRCDSGDDRSRAK